MISVMEALSTVTSEVMVIVIKYMSLFSFRIDDGH